MFTLPVSVAVHSGLLHLGTRLRNARQERGEGVISTAIAVLVMAVIGAAMYLAYNQLFTTTSTKVTSSVNSISG